MDEQNKPTALGGIGVGLRLNNHDRKIKELKKKVSRLEEKLDSASESHDIGMSGKTVKICTDDGNEYVGVVTAVSKFKIKIRLEHSGKERVFNKGHIRWHEEV